MGPGRARAVTGFGAEVVSLAEVVLVGYRISQRYQEHCPPTKFLSKGCSGCDKIFNIYFLCVCMCVCFYLNMIWPYIVLYIAIAFNGYIP